MSPVVKKEFSKTCALDTFQKLLGDDLVGVYVRSIERRDQSLVYAKGLHFVLNKKLAQLKCQLRMSVKCPAMAAAAAIMGLTRCVRPPRPWRPSKFLLLVDAQRSPG